MTNTSYKKGHLGPKAEHPWPHQEVPLPNLSPELLPLLPVLVTISGSPLAASSQSILKSPRAT